MLSRVRLCLRILATARIPLTCCSRQPRRGHAAEGANPTAAHLTHIEAIGWNGARSPMLNPRSWLCLGLVLALQGLAAGFNDVGDSSAQPAVGEGGDSSAVAAAADAETT